MFLPVALGTADIANVVVSTSILIYDTRIKCCWEFVLEFEERGKLIRCFKKQFQFSEWDDLTERSGKFLLNSPRN